MSRLDRLLTLLETGSSPSIRKAAAQQVGEIQKLYPYDLQALLDKVQVYLSSDNWDTRIAAGQAIEAIASHVPQWDAIERIKEKEEEEKLKAQQQQSESNTTTTTTSATTTESKPILNEDEFDLQFKNFDIVKVLNYGAPLLASGGKEFDDEELDPNMDPKELLLKQKKKLKKQLGLDDLPVKLESMDSLFEDKDIAVNSKAAKAKKEKEEKEKKEDISNMLDTTGMSARERNKAKRKARNVVKEKETTQPTKRFKEVKETGNTTTNNNNTTVTDKTKQHITEQGGNSGKIVMESVLDVEKAYNQDEWPFTSLYNDLIIDLFSPTWQIRHGSLVGLREITKKHGAGGGKTIHTPIDSMDYVNAKWLEDFSLRLLCVITLDRFADYTSDQIVAPVRETCTQTLGVVVKYMDQDSVLKVIDILLHLQNNKLWEVRHGGMLGIKYVVAVRLDLIDVILPKILPSIIDGLMDSDDDVRACASETFHPISRYLVEKHLDKLPEILTILWDILLELDDLAVSTSSVLNLLSNFYSYPEVLPPINNNSNNGNDQSSNSSTPPLLPHTQHSKLAHLVPRLYPFFRHNLYSVRLSSIKTLERLIVSTPQDSKTHWLLSILPDLMRFIFQNIILEEKDDIVELSLSTWESLVKIFKPNVIRGACRSYFSHWVTLLSTPPNTLFDKSLLLDGSKLKDSGGTGGTTAAANTRKLKRTIQQQQVQAQQQAQQQQQTIANLDYLVIRNKIIGSTALGQIVRMWPQEEIHEIQDMFYSMLTSISGLHKHLASLILSEAYSVETQLNQPPMFSLPTNTNQYLNQHLLEELDNRTTLNYYMEATNIVGNKLLSDIRVLASSLLNVGIDFSGVELLKILGNNSNSTIPYEQIMPYGIELVTNVYEFCIGYVRQLSVDPNSIQSIIDQLEARKKTILVTIGFVEKIQTEYHTQVLSEMSSLLITSNNIPTKVSAIVRSLMLAIRKDENPSYQSRAAKSLSLFIQLSIDRTPCPNPKIISSMFTLLCDDRTETPLIPTTSTSTMPIKTEKESLLNTQLDVTEPDPSILNDDDVRLAILARKGSVMFFNALCKRFNNNLFESLPSLLSTITNGTMMKLYQQQLQSPTQQLLFNNDELQNVIDEIQLIRVLLPVLNSCYYQQMIQLIEVIFHWVKYPKHQVQLMASKCIARYCQILTLPSMRFLIRNLLPLLGDTRSLTNRMGAINTVSQIIRDMEMQILPYIVFFTIPILGCMSDQDPDQRRVATLCFAKLVKLMPLEKGIPDPVGLDEDLLVQKRDERKFLEQLLDGSKVENYPLPIRINTELRKYQQDGVNWLAFLNKYKLHGILCDDMGLGKTLQTICIIAGDDYHRRVSYQEKGTVDFAPLPSLVICPPSLVGHWFYEIKKFCSDSTMKPMTYMGNPQERQSQRNKFKDHNVLIMSYDIMRNDIDILSEMHFNYCILDEGHIIKNAKTKLTQAAKRLQSNHRLILSGTPIQNNVLELWSLFDFLMPGFLGTEKLFNELYSKPILASKDPKCSTKDQESGVLAMEALHRQVLPFLLRRLKEDVLADLPPKIIQDRYCNLSPLQIRLYDYFSKTQFKENIKQEVVDEDDDIAEDESQHAAPTAVAPVKKKRGNPGGGGATHIFQALQYLRKLCGHPSFVMNPDHPQYNTIMKEFKLQPADILDIAHSPKLVSLKELLLECGIGLPNGNLPLQQLKSSTGANSVAANNAILNEISSSTNQHRVLIFAQMKSMLDIVENELFKKHLPSITYLRMDGSTEAMKRHNIVNQFNSDPTIDVLLLTTHVGGLGLNLTGADTVIFMEHDWNPMKDLQAMDRAHRIGQKKVVNVYRLITSGTLEEKIMGLQKFKLNIANTVINHDNSSLQTMSTNELLNLFDYSDDQKSTKPANIGDYNNESSISDTGEVTTATSGNAQNSGKLKNILDSLGELWDEKQYTDEFNLSNFISSM